MPPQQPPPPKKKHTGRNLLIAAIVVVVVIAACIGGFSIVTNASNNNSPSTTTTAATSAPSQATTVPTATSTPKPSSSLGNEAVIGNTVAVFNAKYGNPVNQTTNQNGSVTYKYQDLTSNIGALDVITFSNSQTIYGIVLAPPAGQEWDATTTLSVCIAFIPDDSKLDQPSNVQDASGTSVGLFQAGSSKELANSLPASDFYEEDSGNSVTPGTFSMLYAYVAGSNGTEVDTCSVAVGKQTTSSLTQG